MSSLSWQRNQTFARNWWWVVRRTSTKWFFEETKLPHLGIKNPSTATSWCAGDCVVWDYGTSCVWPFPFLICSRTCCNRHWWTLSPNVKTFYAVITGRKQGRTMIPARQSDQSHFKRYNDIASRNVSKSCYDTACIHGLASEISRSQSPRFISLGLSRGERV
jgi:hypothetical protein